MKSRTLSGVTLAAFLAVLVGPSYAEISFRTVALTGGAVPQMPTGVSFRRFQQPYIDDNSMISFAAEMQGPGVGWPRNCALLAYGSDASGQLLQKGWDEAPGTGGLRYLWFDNPILNGQGQITTRVVLKKGDQSDPPEDDAIWMGTRSGGELLEGGGWQMPGMPAGARFGVVHRAVVNPSGEAAFRSHSHDLPSGTNETIWRGRPGNLTLVAAEGQAAPGLPDGIVFDGGGYDGFGDPLINAQGHVVFFAALAGPGVSADNQQSIWRAGPDGLRMVARSGDSTPLPGQPTQYASFDTVSTNSQGDVVFTSGISGLHRDEDAVWISRPDGVHPVVMHGQDAPGMPAGTTFDLVRALSMNEQGQIVVLAQLAGPDIVSFNNSGSLWVADGDRMTPIVRQLQAVPNSPEGWLVGVLTPDMSSLNSRGQIVFAGSLISGDPANPNWDDYSESLCGYDPVLGVVVLARKGGAFKVGEGDWRTILDFSLPQSGGIDGMWQNFNDRGEFTFWASFTDGTEGIFVAAIPEPAACTILCLGALAAFRPRR